MKKNLMRYLGLIGLLGLLGLITGNTGFFGFFGYFGFFGLARHSDDEMLRHNLGQAGLNAFIISLLGFPAVIIAGSFFESTEAFLMFFVIFYANLFVVQILTFVISFNIYEKRGNM